MARVYRMKDFPTDSATLSLQETLFHNANGYIGVRGTLEEGLPEGADTMRGMYINGFYDIVPMKQAEKLCGLVEDKEAMLNVADTQSVRIDAEGETFSMLTGTVVHVERVLDMERGVTERVVDWRSPAGHTLHLVFRRMTSFALPNLFTIECEVMPVDFSGVLTFTSAQLGLVKNYANPNDPRLADDAGSHLTAVSHELAGDVCYLQSRTLHTGLTVCTGVAHDIDCPADSSITYDEAAHATSFRFTVQAAQGQTVRLVKYTTIADTTRTPAPLDTAKAAMDKARGKLADYYAKQAEELAHFWHGADMHISGNDEDDSAMLFNMYQLMQSAGRDNLCSIAAKGLSGEGYEGHYFWDTEMYMMPFFILTAPSLARHLLSYRYAILPAARENARVLGHQKGALYPWRTIAGKECSGYFPSGTAQYHIDGDIAYAVVAYYLATEDAAYLLAEGAEILLETSRLWLDVGCWYKGTFRINDVTGPDEYTCMVNNNFYTNACAQYNLRWTVKAVDKLRTMPGFDTWAKRVALDEDELQAMTKAADGMYLPYDKDLGINPQDDSFLQKPVWDIAATPKEHFPLLLHYHPLHLYRYQVCKQADTVLAYFVFDGVADKAVMERSFAYYEGVTTHDSSLSLCIFSIVASRLGLHNKAVAYFGDSLRTDLMNLHHNAKDGIHTANMGGCYMAVVNGFAGLRISEEGLSIAPWLPDMWQGYSFRFHYKGRLLMFAVEKGGCTLTLLEGDGLTVTLCGKVRTLSKVGDSLAEAIC